MCKSSYSTFPFINIATVSHQDSNWSQSKMSCQQLLKIPPKYYPLTNLKHYTLPRSKIPPKTANKAKPRSNYNKLNTPRKNLHPNYDEQQQLKKVTKTTPAHQYPSYKNQHIPRWNYIKLRQPRKIKTKLSWNYESVTKLQKKTKKIREEREITISHCFLSKLDKLA